MPFGDKVDTRLATVKRIDYFPGRQNITSRRIDVPATEPPWWWSEYLTDEWKRRNLKELRRDTRMPGQRRDDEFKRLLLRWSPNDPHFVATPPHQVWGDA